MTNLPPENAPMMPCTCPDCCAQARRDYAKRVREARERCEREREAAYVRKHGPRPTVYEVLRRAGLR